MLNPFLSGINESKIIIGLQLFILLQLFSVIILKLQQTKDISSQKNFRVITFLSTIFGIQFFLFFFLLLSSNTSFFVTLTAFIPLVVLFSFCALMWAWCFPNYNLKIDLFLFIYSFLVFILFILQLIFSFLIQLQILNISLWLYRFQTLFSFIFLWANIIILVVKHPQNWFAGILLIIVASLGFIHPLLIWGSLQTPSVISILLYEALSFLLLPFFPVVTVAVETKKNTVGIKENLQILRSWIEVANPKEKNKIENLLIQALGRSFTADLAILAMSYVSGENQIFIFHKNNQNNKEVDDQFIKIAKTQLENIKKPFITLKHEKNSELQLSLMRAAGFKQTVNFLYFPLQQKTSKNDREAHLFFFSQNTVWEQVHLDLLREMKDDLRQILIHERIADTIEDKFTEEKKSLSFLKIEAGEKYKSWTRETDAEKIHRLELELKLALEEYDRLQKLHEAYIRTSASVKK